MNKLCKFFLCACLAVSFIACSTPTTGTTTDSEDGGSAFSSTGNLEKIYSAVTSSGTYTSRDSVAAYLCKFEQLPHNYISKDEGQKLYESSTGNTFSKWNFNPWKTLSVMIGGDSFDNFVSDSAYYHSSLPEGNYHEADVDYGDVQSRGTKRLVYQGNCIIYYTADHYETFTQLMILK